MPNTFSDLRAATANADLLLRDNGGGDVLAHAAFLVEASAGDGEEEFVAGGVGEAVIGGSITGITLAGELSSQHTVNVCSDNSRGVDVIVLVLSWYCITFAVHVVQREYAVSTLHYYHVRLGLKEICAIV